MRGNDWGQGDTSILTCGYTETALCLDHGPWPSTGCYLAQDEPFHARQTRQYCTGNWADWDPKITTFPGLYLVGVAYARLLQLALHIWSTPTVSEVSNLP